MLRQSQLHSPVLNLPAVKMHHPDSTVSDTERTDKKQQRSEPQPLDEQLQQTNNEINSVVYAADNAMQCFIDRM